MTEEKAVQKKMIMALICWFAGALGIHRLLMGYKNWWLMLITVGGCGIWTLYDLIMILTDKMPMADGRPLEK
ncbi:MAG: TM2 domain-containing protein [Bacteroidales bacterium]|nr:TM2 domain-containing protein [Bacteroidales bacterium]MDY0313800.1 TM2 domain-containing protein [Bacteroidales bacterium]